MSQERTSVEGERQESVQIISSLYPGETFPSNIMEWWDYSIFQERTDNWFSLQEGIPRAERCGNQFLFLVFFHNLFKFFKNYLVLINEDLLYLIVVPQQRVPFDSRPRFDSSARSYKRFWCHGRGLRRCLAAAHSICRVAPSKITGTAKKNPPSTKNTFTYDSKIFYFVLNDTVLPLYLLYWYLE